MQRFFQPQTTASDNIHLRTPSTADGVRVHELIARCPPLDMNSMYCNLLQCSLFSGTCVIAEADERLLGFVSGFVSPDQPHTLFIWQIAVASEARGTGLARSMLQSLLKRPACEGVSHLQTTITPGNLASWALFGSLARVLDTGIKSRVLFDRKQHFADRHDTEMLVTVGPFASSPAATASIA
ncbi:MAG: diaminobutyrate acetyltransferase [Steroidobacteraceae bacterium]